MKKRIVALLFGALVLINSSFAARQDRIIKGRVVDAADGEALEWVTVAVRDASGKIYDGTTTDALGAFKLNAAGGSELYFSLLGYKDVVVKELSNDMCPDGGRYREHRRSYRCGQGKACGTEAGQGRDEHRPQRICTGFQRFGTHKESSGSGD